MKFNLKNFPRTAQGENRDTADIWAEDFEKELREMHLIACGYEQRVTRSVVRAVLKEILGE